jgi:hypothetical protein
MMRLGALFLALMMLSATELSAQKGKAKKIKDVAVNADEAGPEYLVQGEYEGKLGNEKIGAQVVARGNGRFDIFFSTGGLPGAGWDGKLRQRAQAKTEDDKTILTDKKWNGQVGGGKLAGKKGDDEFRLEKVERKSKTLDAKPPAGAVVLFDGTNTEAWSDGKMVEDNLLFRGTASKQSFGAGKYHVEFRTPFQPKYGGQGRGNSGVFVQGYEIQVLDSFGTNGEKDDCGAFYGRAKPLVNMCFPPLSWQTYDVEIKASAEGNTVATVLHNGVLIHDNIFLRKGPPKPSRILLQDHGDPVVFRNIWVLPAVKKEGTN